MTSSSSIIDEIKSRLIVIDRDKMTLEFYNHQNYYRVIELLEDQGKRFFMFER